MEKDLKKSEQLFCILEVERREAAGVNPPS
jgi:hypothetical protein